MPGSGFVITLCGWRGVAKVGSGWRLHHAVVNQIVGRHSTSVLLRSDMGASRSKAVCHAALRQDHRLVARQARVWRSPLEAGSTIRKPSPLLLATP